MKAGPTNRTPPASTDASWQRWPVKTQQAESTYDEWLASERARALEGSSRRWTTRDRSPPSERRKLYQVGRSLIQMMGGDAGLILIYDSHSSSKRPRQP